MKNSAIVMVVLILIVGVGAFYGGMKYQSSQTPASNFRQGGGGRGQGGQRNGGRPVMGEILNADDKSITVKMQDGSSKIVVLSDSTQINKSDTAVKSDLKTGEKVAVFGSDNSDYKTLDFGVGLLGGVSLKNGLSFSVNYDLGLSNLLNTPSYKIKNSVIGFSVSYYILKGK